MARKGRLKKMINKTELVTTNMEKAEELNNFFASVFNGNLSSCLQGLRFKPLNLKAEMEAMKSLPL